MNKEEILLFVGDSITESGRFHDPEGIGDGYVKFIRDYLSIAYPYQCPKVINKGISGNHITDLLERWERDVIEVRPDYVSISIGINDVWRRLDHSGKELVFPDRYESLLRYLIEETNKKLKAKIILMEPTIHGEEANSAGNRMLTDYVKTVVKLSEEYNTILVPTHQAFLQHLQDHPEEQLTTDGVHMNEAGNKLMAKTWLNAFIENSL